MTSIKLITFAFVVVIEEACSSYHFISIRTIECSILTGKIALGIGLSVSLFQSERRGCWHYQFGLLRVLHINARRSGRVYTVYCLKNFVYRS